MSKRIERFIVMICCLLVMSCNSQVVKETPFKVGDIYYSSLQDACDAAIAASMTTATDSEIVVKIVKDASGPGIYVNLESSTSFPIPLLIDLGNNCYTVTGAAAKAALKADFDISSVLLVISGDKGKLIGNGSTLFSFKNSQLDLSGSLDIEVPEGAYFADAKSESGIIFDAYFDGSVNGKINLNNSKMYIQTKEGNIDIDRLSICGSDSQLIFGEVRDPANTHINSLTMDSKAQSGIAITTSQFFTEEENKKIDEILDKSGWKVHRHAFNNTDGQVYMKATCRSNRYDAFTCTEPNCGFIDVREIYDTKDSSEHSLVHVKAVVPTARTSGIMECEECEWCHNYFVLSKSLTSMTQVNPVLLATDNVLYSDMVEAGIDSLNASVQSLEDELRGTVETKGTVSTVSSVISTIFTAINTIHNLIDKPVTQDAKLNEMINDLNIINNKMDVLKSEVARVSEKLDKNTYYSFYNNRVRELNDLYVKTNPYYKRIAEKLTGSGSEAEKMETLKNVVSEWAKQQGDNVITLTITYLMNAVNTSTDQLKILEVYDYIGRSSLCWENLSKDCRVAMRSYDELTMMQGYIMSEWYYKYCYNGEETSKLDLLRKQWEAYKSYCNEARMKTSSQPTCWLYYDGGEFKPYAFNQTPIKIDYSKELKEKDYRFAYNFEKDVKENINQLIKDVDGECSSSKFFDHIYTCFNEKSDSKNNDKKNMYEILEMGGFKEADGTKLSECTKANKYIITDPNKKFTYKDIKKYESNTVEYRMFYYMQNSILDVTNRVFGHFSVYVLGNNTVKILDKVRFGRKYTICSCENTGNKFYKLKAEEFRPVS